MKIDDVKRILVVGAGQMGAQIAMQSALHGYAITLNDLHGRAPEGHGGQPEAARAAGAKGQMTQGPDGSGPRPGAAGGGPRAGRPRRRLRHRGHRGAARAEEGVLRPAGPGCPPHAILATNSSTLDELADRALHQAPRQVRQHALLLPAAGHAAGGGGEGPGTSEETVETPRRWPAACGREPVVLRKELPGFLVNRILRALGTRPITPRAGRGQSGRHRQGGGAGAQPPHGAIPARAICPGSTSATTPGSRPSRSPRIPRPAAPRAGEARQARRSRPQDRARLLRLLEDPPKPILD